MSTLYLLLLWADKSWKNSRLLDVLTAFSQCQNLCLVFMIIKDDIYTTQ